MNKEIEKTEQQLIDALIAKRAYFRERNRVNYHKRKEAGTLKKRPSQKQSEYIYKPKNLKDAPTAEDVEKIKYVKPKPKLIKIDEIEYNKFLEFKSLNEKTNI